MEYGKKFSMEWDMEWKILVWNGRNVAVWNMENRLPFYSIACPEFIILL